MTHGSLALHSPDTGVIVVAAGRGERLGADRPKAFVHLSGIPLLSYSIHTITGLAGPGHLVVVVPASLIAETQQLAAAATPPESQWQTTVVAGGSERDESVRFGLDTLHPAVTTVLVHDAARPLTPAALFERVIARVQETGDGVIPAMPVTDTIKRVGSDGIVRETVDRNTLAAVQTPQGFVRSELAAAHHTHLSQTVTTALPTDDAEVVQRAGGTIRIETGDPQAMKVTTAADLTMLTATLATLPAWFHHDQSRTTGAPA